MSGTPGAGRWWWGYFKFCLLHRLGLFFWTLEFYYLCVCGGGGGDGLGKKWLFLVYWPFAGACVCVCGGGSLSKLTIFRSLLSKFSIFLVLL